MLLGRKKIRMLSMKSQLRVILIFLLNDVILLYVLFRMAVPIRNYLLFNRGILFWEMVSPLVGVGIVLCIFLFFMSDLYPGYGLTAVKELERVSKAVFMLFVALASFSFLNKPFQDFSRAFLLISWGLALLLLPFSRFLLRNLLSRYPWYGVPVVVIGAPEEAEKVIALLRRVRRLGWQAVERYRWEDISRSNLKARNANIAILVGPLDWTVKQHAHYLSQSFGKIVLVQSTYGFGSVWVIPRDLDGQLGLEFHYHLFESTSRLVKRVIDLLVAGILLLLFAPVIAIVALLIKVDSPGPVFYRHERVGYLSRRFCVLKFRTMVVDAEKRLSDLLEDPERRSEFEKFYKLRNDPRITRVGKWLRRFSFDEFPQLWNVLMGEMSLVGPRPRTLSEVENMREYASVILRVRPGITGWWQVMGRHNVPFERRLEMEEYYVSNWSLWMDFYILMKTVWVILSGRGA